MPRSLLIVDDHPSFRSLAGAILSADGFDVRGDVPDGESALDAVAALDPDVVLLDVQLPGIDGFEVAARLAAVPDPPAIVLTSSRDASDYGSRLAAAPVRGFISKHELSGDGLTALLEAA
jgi:DNA-binding NarL/FixJ family response regulator